MKMVPCLLFKTSRGLVIRRTATPSLPTDALVMCGFLSGRKIILGFRGFLWSPGDLSPEF